MSSKQSQQKYPPLLLKYLKMFQDDPTSRIFAPLAESYRKIGLIDESIEICKDGLLANPDFSGGKVALARAYADKGMHRQVQEVLESVVNLIPDNIVAQRLYADACLSLGEPTQALSSLKLLLYFNPTDESIRGVVQDLETQMVQGGALLKSGKSSTQFGQLMKLQGMLARVQRYSAGP